MYGTVIQHSPQHQQYSQQQSHHALRQPHALAQDIGWINRWFSSAASRASNASDTPLPFAAVRRIHADAGVLERAFTAAAAAVAANGVAAAAPHSRDAYAKAVALLAFAEQEVDRARESMKCCKVGEA